MIAIAPAHKSQIDSYINYVTKLGIPLKILSENESLDGYSMLMLCGGPDIGDDLKRDIQETKWFDEALDKKIPVIGICRGLQLANVCLGGTLHKDIKNHTPIIKEGISRSKFESSFHHVKMDNMLYTVNSRHHQAIDRLADGLVVRGISLNDEIIEMVEYENSLFVQWHPEREDIFGEAAEYIVSNWIIHNNQKFKFNVGDQVLDTVRRSIKGIIHSININLKYPLEVKFENNHFNRMYTLDGKFERLSLKRTLYKVDEIRDSKIKLILD